MGGFWTFYVAMTDMATTIFRRSDGGFESDDPTFRFNRGEKGGQIPNEMSTTTVAKKANSESIYEKKR